MFSFKYDMRWLKTVFKIKRPKKNTKQKENKTWTSNKKEDGTGAMKEWASSSDRLVDNYDNHGRTTSMENVS